MTKLKIVHIAVCDKFIPPFIEFIKENFDFERHEFLLTAGMAEGTLKFTPNVHLAKASKKEKIKHYSRIIIQMHRADKIILHGLFNIRIVQILFLMPWLLKKCYWIMWGWDLYTYQCNERNSRWRIHEFFRRPVIRQMGHLVTYIHGDVDLARQWYKAEGQYHECLMYGSNLCKNHAIPKKQHSTINIQVGNSADPSNNHIEALEKLLMYKDDDICIYMPLSYGDQEYAQQIIKQGEAWFGCKFRPLTEFMPFGAYLEFLGSIDIAIFNHRRQQAMGNIITLLGLGKTVYMRSDTTHWNLFKKKNILVRDISKLNIFDVTSNEKNITIIKNCFSKSNLLMQLEELF